ncbi:glycoside hydrolase [Chloropicon primus]|nr:glycoside hydrolase [Chloropicon primus]
MFLRRVVEVPASALAETSANELAILVEPPDHVGCVDLGGQGGPHDSQGRDQPVRGGLGLDPADAGQEHRAVGLRPPSDVRPGFAVRPRVRVTFRKGAESGAQARLTVGCRNLSQETVRVVIRASARPRGQSRGRGARGPREGQQWAKTVELGARQVAGSSTWDSRASRTRCWGNYIVPDAMLRCDRERCWTEVRHHAEMGLNMIRLWGGAGVPYAEFYEACDFFGIMVWSEFWITGDCDGRGATKDSPESNPDWPLDHQLFLECACDVPCKELDDGLRALVGEKGSLDDSRPYVSGSLWGGFGQGGGDWSDGPYGIQNESDFWSDSFYPYGFNPELGSVGVPCAESIRTMFTKPGDQNPPKFVKNADGTVTEVVPKSWEFHKYITYTTSSGRSKILSYGEPENLDEYCQRAQIVNFTQYKALAEAWGSRMWTKYTGMLIWKTTPLVLASALETLETTNPYGYARELDLP